MFLLQQILRCGPGRQAEALPRLHWIHEQMAAHSGAAGMMVAKYLGNPSDYLILRQWQDRAAYDDFMSGPGGHFPRSKPAGLYDSLDVGHNWEEVLFTPGYAQGSFLWRSRFEVLPENWDEFIRLRRDDDKLAQWFGLAEHPGDDAGVFVSSHTFRSTDNHNEALAIVRLKDRGAMEDIVASPSRTEIVGQLMQRATHDGRAAAPRDSVWSDCFEVVDEIPSN
jgi:quinol monooxygenase YgiN